MVVTTCRPFKTGARSKSFASFGWYHVCQHRRARSTPGLQRPRLQLRWLFRVFRSFVHLPQTATMDLQRACLPWNMLRAAAVVLRMVEEQLLPVRVKMDGDPSIGSLQEEEVRERQEKSESHRGNGTKKLPSSTCVD